MAVCVSVVIDDIVSKIDKPYDYYLPSDTNSEVLPGMRVIVPFSRSNIRKKALILDVYSREDIVGLKPVIAVVDEEPLINDLQLDLLKILKSRYFVTYFRALKSIVPRGIDIIVKEQYSIDSCAESEYPEFYSFFVKEKGKITPGELRLKDKRIFDDLKNRGLITKNVSLKQKLGDKIEKKLVLNVSHSELEDIISKTEKRFTKQIDLLYVFLEYSELSYKDAMYYSGCTESTIKTLLKKGVFIEKKEKIARNPYSELERKNEITDIKLNADQKKVYESILEKIDSYNTHLIHGVTGSGKTLIYISLIDQAVKLGKSVIFMVPEISLTPQMLERFYGRYGDMVAVIHSGLNPGERADEWKKIKSSSQSIVVGTRSSVFSPVNNLGLVIIDEEHESSYKSESTPKYHARDLSKYICKRFDIPLILGSATPSIESCYFGKKGIYKYHTLTKRFNNNPLPFVEIIDMKNTQTEGEQSFLSEQLSEMITENLDKKEQTILFLNRRGANSMVGCRSCGHVEKCPNCGIALTYHSVNNRCMCHYCGFSIKMYNTCPVCESKHIKKLGVGTQLVASELADKFPGIRILRMDFDTVSSYVEYGQKLNAFKDGEYDIMLGTQMVAKGLDFPNVTLVGVLNADLSLHVEDFRANERTFSLLTQVCGRSGRAGKEGSAIIQTYSPDYEIIRYAKDQDYEKYYDFEIKFRKAMNYPPFCDLVQFVVSSQNEKKAYSKVMEIYDYINEISKNEFSDIPIRLLYPVTPKIAKFNEKYRFSLTIKTKISVRLYDALNLIAEKFDDNVTSVSININPMNSI